jgi:hypothetical protein
MTAGEDQLEALVLDLRVLDLIHGRLGSLEQPRLLGQGALAPESVDCPVAGGCEQPADRVRRNPIALPTLGGDRECLLSGLLGEVEVAKEADQRGKYPAPMVAEDVLEQR